MPKAFEQCIRKKGTKVRTISGPDKRWGLKKGQYLHICIDGDKVYRGEVKTKKGY